MPRLVNVSALRAALRIARRDARRAGWRSVLVVVLIGLPVFALTLVDVGWRTYQLSPAQQLDRAIGTADVAVQATGSSGPLAQSPSGWLADGGYSPGPAPSGHPAPPSRAELMAAMPSGSRVLTWVQDGDQLAIRTAAGIEYASMTGLDYADPLAKGIVTQVSGRAPQTPREAAITQQLAHQTGLAVGDTLATTDGQRFRIVGVVHDNQSRADVGVYTLPSAVPSSALLYATWLVHTGSDFSWQQVLALNKVGFLVVSRSVVLDPPPASEVTFHAASSGVPASTLTGVGLLAGMGLLEVVLLAGPAFAVGAKRRRRDLALIAAAGGRRSDLRHIVLADGVVLGVLAGIIGVVGGIAAAGVGLAWFGGRTSSIPGPFDVRPLEVAGIALVGLVTALLAALIPAWSASRTDIVSALAGRRGQLRASRRVPIVGCLVAGLGVVTALLGEGAGRNVNLIVGGVAVTELGLVVLTPTLLGLIAKLGRIVPFSVRISLRDAARNRSAASPAVAAVMAAMIGAISLAIVGTSQTDLARREYVPYLPSHVALVPLSSTLPGNVRPASAGSVERALRADLPTSRVAPLMLPGEPRCPGLLAGKPCPNISITVAGSAAEPRLQDVRSAAHFGTVVVDNGAAVETMFGVRDPAAVTALRHGAVVVRDASVVHDGRVTLVATTSTYLRNGTVLTSPNVRRVTVRAVVLSGGFHAADVVIPPSVEMRLTGLAPRTTGVLAQLTASPTDAQKQAANASLAALQPYLPLQIETGFQDNNRLAIDLIVLAAAIVALGAAGVATGLANVDGRDDLITLGAVGASPRVRRLVSMSRALVIAGLGCLIGTAAAFVPAVAWVQRQANQTVADYTSAGARLTGPQLHLVVPWPQIGLAAVGVPIVAMLVAGVFTRSRLPSERRTD